MDSTKANRHVPLYPTDLTKPNEDIQSFITNFYRISDNQDENERWVNSFTEDAHVQIGGDIAQGPQEIRELRERMWSVIKERKHTVIKAFPGQFKGSHSVSHGEVECEFMLLGEAEFLTRDGRIMEADWSAHAIVRKEGQEWKLEKYRVWIQNSG